MQKEQFWRQAIMLLLVGGALLIGCSLSKENLTGNSPTNPDPLAELTPAPGDAPKWVTVPALLPLLNIARATGRVCGGEGYFPPAAAVAWNDQLARAALSHSIDMAAHDHFSHTGTDGSQPWDRARAAGYPSTYVGENVAVGYTSEQAVVTGWLNSAGHCKNIMTAAYAEIGAAYAKGYSSQIKSEALFWTLNLGKAESAANPDTNVGALTPWLVCADFSPPRHQGHQESF